jgi:NADPH:quinone reductase-like Zn-dependent oxidoreductase
VIEVRELPVPVPGDVDVLVRVHAAALNPKDIVLRSGRFAFLSGRRFPRRIGFDFAGEVVGRGASVQTFREGDRVFGMLDGFTGGACAEYVLARAHWCARVPESLSFGEAASLPLASLTALQALRDLGHLRAGGAVCINGASGGVGVHAIQIARALGGHVTSISSGRNLELCRSLGAEAALDYERDVLFLPSASFDVVLDAFGNRSFREVEAALAPNGVFVGMVPKPGRIWDVARTSVASKRARFVVVRSKPDDLQTVRSLAESGALRPVIDRSVPLDDIRLAFQHLETKRARGKIVISMVGTR